MTKAHIARAALEGIAFQVADVLDVMQKDSGIAINELRVDGGASANNDEILPSISEISLSGAQALPELHLDVHVYATKPGDRFVYINMRKYKEGAVLQEGPRVELIRRDGVVLNFQGVRFILPRLS